MIQKKYSFLETIGTLPKMVDAGLQYLGVKELPGQANNPVIMNMAKQLDILHIYNNETVAWCGLFMAYIMKLVGKPMPYEKYEILRAASFATWGNPAEIKDMQLGDVVVFKRPGGNHVAIVIAVSNNVDGKIGSVHCLGGNQSNAVTIAEFPINRVTHVRRFYATAAPESAKQYIINSSGIMSVNEA